MTKNEKIERLIELASLHFPPNEWDEGRTLLHSLKTKPKTEVVKYYSLDVEYCYLACIEFFPEHLKPSYPLNWMDIIDKLNRIDGVPFSDIIAITSWARNNEFWSSNFLSLAKLRSTDKQGIKYIIIFNEKMQNENRQNSKSGVSNQDLADNLSKHFDKD